MGRISRDIVEAVRDRTDIVEVVSRHVQIVRRGKDFLGLCPFHQEKSPSFHVIPDKAMFYCFGCHAAGDVFGFLKEIEGLSFIEAVKELAAAAGIDVEEDELSPQERGRIRQRASLYEVLEAAGSFFTAALWTGNDGAAARTYLEGRAIDPELCKRAGLGFAPGGWTRLMDHLHSEGFPPERIIEAGLAKNRDGGRGAYDLFRDRLMIPIRDDRGRIIAFGGRIMAGDGPKYINSPETPLYQKSKVLYGLDMARRGIGQRDRAVVVEGYFDVLAMHHAGFTETVAACGTALTPEHLEKLRRLTRNVVVLTDSDAAGSKAAEKSLPLFVTAGIHAMRLQLEGGRDPDDLIRESGVEAMAEALEHTEPLLEWVVRRKREAHGYDAMGSERVVEEMTEVLSKLSGAAVSRVARMLDYREDSLLERLRSQQSPRHDAPPPPPPTRGWRPTVQFVHIFWLLVHRYDQVADLMVASDPGLMRGHEVAANAIARLIQGENVTSILDDEPDPGVRRTLEAVVARRKLYDVDQAKAGLCGVLAGLAEPLRRAKLEHLKQEVQAAQRASDPEASRAALHRIAELRRAESGIAAALRAGDSAACIKYLGPTSSTASPQLRT